MLPLYRRYEGRERIHEAVTFCRYLHIGEKTPSTCWETQQSISRIDDTLEHAKIVEILDGCGKTTRFGIQDTKPEAGNGKSIWVGFQAIFRLRVVITLMWQWSWNGMWEIGGECTREKQAPCDCSGWGGQQTRVATELEWNVANKRRSTREKQAPCEVGRCWNSFLLEVWNDAGCGMQESRSEGTCSCIYQPTSR